MLALLRNSGKALSSLRLTVTLLALAMVLIFVATLSQVHLGIYEVQIQFFRSWIAWWDIAPGARHIAFPLPGGMLLGTLLVINLVAAHGARFKLRWNKVGMILIHGGVLLLLLGELFTGILGKESQMSIDEGQVRNYSTFQREIELAVIDTSTPGEELVHAIPQSRLQDGAIFQLGDFALRVERYFQNSEILPESTKGHSFDPTRASQGVGKPFAVKAKPRETAMDRRDISAAFVDIIPAGGEPLGRWLLSNVLRDEQSFEVAGKSWKFAIRQRRFYHPFSIKLIDFSHDRYLGTSVPKNFSSKIRVLNPDTGENREDLIYMNHPLRYQGLTFYQQGFDNDDTTSIFQVVRNPVWTLPYIACLMVGGGLMWVFSQHLFKAISRRKTASGS